MKLSEEQISFLEDTFTRLKSPSPLDIFYLEVGLNVPSKEIETWFKNKRKLSSITSKRTRIPKESIDGLLETFKVKPFPSRKEYKDFEIRFNIPTRTIRYWFSIRRKRIKAIDEVRYLEQ
jgi:hypothetical protein